ncbi:hypothetical protein [Kozakia baliensis]|uniref:hypothetical protein n=1 Tax=Kozakia baliensis TaxID=153496 RepID=UPI001169967A|nr:hypothetical protein [Kozakia baliensis]GBR27051.1 hypothetical protein AA0488_1032 [Kozakia baliensis NRIC 0488]GEL65702.1 hypothetical protein KBA01_29880 [Kozakia baliensis]
MHEQLYAELVDALREVARQHDARQVGRRVSGHVRISVPLFDALMTESLAESVTLRCRQGMQS